MLTADALTVEFGGQTLFSDISFVINPQDRIALMGKNGAGKSTLLKLLSRITEPTEGEAWLRGRVSSLLEVGTGFHPELTGRDNVFLSGTILGMTRQEIRQRFDADVERFSNLETGQSATIDAPLAMELITQAAHASTPEISRILSLWKRTCPF